MGCSLPRSNKNGIDGRRPDLQNFFSLRQAFDYDRRANRTPTLLVSGWFTAILHLKTITLFAW